MAHTNERMEIPQPISARQSVAARALLNMSQQELADKAGVSKFTLQILEGNQKLRADPSAVGHVSDESMVAIIIAFKLCGIKFISATDKVGSGVRLI